MRRETSKEVVGASPHDEGEATHIGYVRVQAKRRQGSDCQSLNCEMSCVPGADVFQIAEGDADGC